MLAVVCHDHLVSEFSLQKGSFLISILTIMQFVEIIDEDKDSLAADDLLG